MLTYQQAVKYLDTFLNYEKKGFEGVKKEMDLERVRSALKKLGRPEKNYPSVHVAGTKGKGSVAVFTRSILSETGYRTGLFTSPHLSDPRERIEVDGRSISREDLARTVELLMEMLPESSSKELTYFEIYTLLAMLYFSRQKVDAAVFETGLGGRLDATNVIQPRVAAITPISYDHTDILGRTIQKIAREKAAIIKRGSRCVSSPQKAGALEVIERRCLEVNVPLTLVGADLAYMPKTMLPDGSVFDVTTSRSVYQDCRVTMPGEFQVENAAAAVAICEDFCEKEKRMDPQAVKRGIQKAFLPGRMEIISREPLILIDGAQNAASCERLKYSVEHIFEYDRLILLLGLSRDKDIKGVCSAFEGLADNIILTKSAHERALDPELIRGYIKGGDVKITASSREALGVALSKARKGDMVLAAGSFYLIGEIRLLAAKKKKTSR